ncbi:MAG: hypothetical protein A3G77_11990 [Acidobacteria bacterium RIFCSPLOWO2_12_FULL_68_19]|nr:MAG: hypothetical protein A3G77_11990 [Acidobacteria bacterium RIFCSPLOWO2_12_FULL_68_19]
MLRTVLLLLGFAVLAILSWRLGPADIAMLVGRVGWFFVPALALYAGHQALRALALHACVLRRGLLGYGDALAIRLSGEAIQSLPFTGPVLAEPTRAWLLTRRGLTLQEGFAAALTEYLISAFVTAALSVAGLLYIVGRYALPPIVASITGVVVGLFALFLVASGVAIARRFYLIGTFIGGMAGMGLLRGRLRPDLGWINRMEDLLLAILRDRPGRFAAVALVELAAQVPLVLELFVLLHALDLGAQPAAALLIEASAKAIGIVFMVVPQQMGVAEGSYALIFDVLLLPAASGFAVALLRRIRALLVTGAGLAMLARLTKSEAPVAKAGIE